MKNTFNNCHIYMTKILMLVFIFLPAKTFACACSNGMFDVATSALIPTRPGGSAFLEYNHIIQDKNWHKDDEADNDNNHDKKITTQIVTFNGQYMFNRKWGLMARVPFVDRSIHTLAAHSHSHDHDHDHEEAPKTLRISSAAIGDIKLTGIYSGFSKNMSTGLIFGAKLPSGANKKNGIERDMQIGSGSYDAILGFYHIGKIDQNAKLGWFTQATWQKPLITKAEYHPGSEISGSIGSYYNINNVANFARIAPMLQLIATHKKRDSGLLANNANTGYSKLFIAPAIELNYDKFKIYADIEFPLYENVNGNQLAVTRAVKVILGYKF